MNYLDVIFLVEPILIGLNKLMIKQIAIFHSFHSIFPIVELHNASIIIPDGSVILDD